MEIYVYDECCAMAGKVVCNPEDYIERDDAGEITHISADINLYGTGTRWELVSQAIDSLRVRRDNRIAGAGDDYRWKCDRNVMESLNGPEVYYDQSVRAYVVSPPLPQDAEAEEQE